MRSAEDHTVFFTAAAFSQSTKLPPNMASNDSNKNNDNNSNVNAILEVLKQNGVNPQQVTSMNLRDEDDEKKGHKFWGTQVREITSVEASCLFQVSYLVFSLNSASFLLPYIF